MLLSLLIGGNCIILAVFWISRLFQKEKRISEEAAEKSLKLSPGFVVESRRNSILRRKSIDLSKVMDQQLAARMHKLHKKFAKHATAQHAFDLPNIIYQLTKAKDHFSSASRSSTPKGTKWRKNTGSQGSITSSISAPNFEEKLEDIIRASFQKSQNSLLSFLYDAQNDEQEDESRSIRREADRECPKRGKFRITNFVKKKRF
ncbi:unnamed protein product [Oikopleura dioica]|uniref:Uncharacterized protein n=1 Tax=Oikopleura dioica TaxID=34765 RepID=E4Y5R3_OIKDI|nr:unnamed protein product [Oikopleura dioica]